MGQPIYPWKPGDWTVVAGPEHAVTHLSLPESVTHGWPIKKGRPGMETLLLLAREKPLPPGVSLQGLLTGLPQAPVKDRRTLVWFDDWSLVEGAKAREAIVKSSDTIAASGDRGPQFFTEIDVKDSVLQIQKLLKERLEGHFSMMRAVSFANQGG